MPPMKMKRRSVSDHHFSDFSPSSPAVKIRRLHPLEDQPQPPLSEPVINDEGAIVLFKPPPISFTVDSNIISAIKDKQRWSAQSDPIISTEQNGRLAIVPWVPSSITPASHVSNTDPPDFMDIEAEEEEDSSNYSVYPTPEGSHQWQQQHCLLPQLLHNISNPITWT